jgi:hypothetical protein
VSETDVTFSRLTELNVKLSPGSIRTYGEAVYDGISLVQTWGGETSWSGPWWRTGTDARYILNSDEDPSDSEDYFGSWIRDYVYIAPAGGEAINREIHHSFDGRLGRDPVEVAWTPEIRIKSSRSPSWNQENRWAGTISIPMDFETWSITPSYRRDFRYPVDTTSRSNDGFDDSWSIYADEMAGQWPIAVYVPFRELLTTEDGDTFARQTEGSLEADYDAELALSASRSSGSDIKDLFVPSSGSLSMERRYQRKGDTVGWENEWRYSVGFSAVNLFGRFGRYPVFGFYNTEEISYLIQLTLADLNGAPAPGPQDLLWQTDWTFIGNRSRRLVLDHRIDWNWDGGARRTTQEARLEYRWRTPSKDVLRLPLVRRAIPRQHYMESTERFAVQGIYPWDDAPSTTIFDVGFIFYHESAWVFEDTGHLKGWLALGIGGRDGEFTNGWELGLEAEIRF